jgi:hypothetical protein
VAISRTPLAGISKDRRDGPGRLAHADDGFSRREGTTAIKKAAVTADMLLGPNVTQSGIRALSVLADTMCATVAHLWQMKLLQLGRGQL